MCWYSRSRQDTRTALEGQALQFFGFPTGGGGETLNWPASPSDPKTPVCLVSGQFLKLNVPQSIQERLDVGPEEVAVFLENYEAGHCKFVSDVLVFRNGHWMKVRNLPLGTTMDYLGATPVTTGAVPEAAVATVQPEELVPVEVAVR